MFQKESFIEKCCAALKERDSHAAVREFVAGAVSDPLQIVKAIGEPRRAGVETIYRADDLTILNLCWGPQMKFKPHDHRMWADIGIYGGCEHNDTVILPLQNGMVSIDQLISQVDTAQVYGAISWVNAAVESPGCVRQRVPGKLIFGQLNGGISTIGLKLKHLFEISGIQVELHDDIAGELWRKFIFICAVNGMTAFTRKPVGKILSLPKERDLFIRIMYEVEKVGRSRAAFPEDTVNNIIDYLEKEMSPEILN